MWIKTLKFGRKCPVRAPPNYLFVSSILTRKIVAIYKCLCEEQRRFKNVFFLYYIKNFFKSQVATEKGAVKKWVFLSVKFVTALLIFVAQRHGKASASFCFRRAAYDKLAGAILSLLDLAHLPRKNSHMGSQRRPTCPQNQPIWGPSWSIRAAKQGKSYKKVTKW